MCGYSVIVGSHKIWRICIIYILSNGKNLQNYKCILIEKLNNYCINLYNRFNTPVIGSDILPVCEDLYIIYLINSVT